jgi:hypothetical protein
MSPLTVKAEANLVRRRRCKLSLICAGLVLGAFGCSVNTAGLSLDVGSGKNIGDASSSGNADADGAGSDGNVAAGGAQGIDGSAGVTGEGGAGVGGAGATGIAGQPGGGGETGGEAGGAGVGAGGSSASDSGVDVGGTGGTAGAGSGGDAGGSGGTAGASACQDAVAVERKCTLDADCVAVKHTTNCCGSAIWIGIRASAAQHFSSLEQVCDASYPACGCAAGQPVAEDGSLLQVGEASGVACAAGVCKTFSQLCGHACDVGRTCAMCGAKTVEKSMCSLRCSIDKDCTDPMYTKCHSDVGGGVCEPPDAMCTL